MTYLTDTIINRINRSAIVSCVVFLTLNIFLRHSILERMFTPISILVIVLSVPAALLILAVGYYGKHKGHILTSLRVPDSHRRLKMAAKGAGFGAFLVWLAASMLLIVQYEGMLRAFIIGVLAFVFFFVLLLVFLWALIVQWKTAPVGLARSAGSSLFTLRVPVLIVFQRWVGTLSIILAVLLSYFFGDDIFGRSREMGAVTIPFAAGSLLMLVAAFIQAVCGSFLRNWVKTHRINFDPRREYESFGQELWSAFWRNSMWLAVVAVVALVIGIAMIIVELINFHG